MQEYELQVAGNGAEAVPYNDPEYPLYAGKGRLHDFKGMGAIDHWHWDMEFAYVLSGTMSYTINQKTVTVRAGDGIFISSGQIHRNFSADGTDAEYLCVLIHPSALQTPFHKAMQSINNICAQNSVPFIVLQQDIPWHKGLIDAINALHEYITSDIGGNILAVLACAYGIAHSLMTNIPHVKSSSCSANELRAMRAMMGYIHMNYDHKILVSDVSRAGHVGNSTCHSLFRRFLGMSPMEYLLNYRIGKATDLLENSDTPMSEIADKTGFASPSYFSECFKEKYALSPSAYRNHVRQTEKLQPPRVPHLKID